MLLVSYADLKACLQSAYNELKASGTGTPHGAEARHEKESVTPP